MQYMSGDLELTGEAGTIRNRTCNLWLGHEKEMGYCSLINCKFSALSGIKSF